MIGLSFNVCPHKIKSDTNHPLTTKKQDGGGGGFVQASTIFSAQSVWCLWVGK